MTDPIPPEAVEQLRRRAEEWLADDPDPAARAELRAVLDGLPAAAAELADRFAGPLRFGTAGLRGPLRAGPNGMNQAVVRAAAAGLVRWLASRGATGPLVIGYDARHGSREFAEETARVATGVGRRALLLPRPLPTPVLAYAVRALDAVAGVMVTASHNPPGDNGYKVYLGAALGGPGGAGAQIVPPADAEISAAIAAVGKVSAAPLGAAGEVLDGAVLDGYIRDAAATLAPQGTRALSVVCTSLHGVGDAVLSDAFAAAGFSRPASVPEQAAPDPEFPTVAFPNPEEPGAMDRVLALAVARDADLAIANDPDADRCAIAAPSPGGAASAGDSNGTSDPDLAPGSASGSTPDSAPEAAPGWRILRGDEVGVLLADHLMRRGTKGRYATTIVSSSMLRAMCVARGAPYGETLTGFKWIVRAGVDSEVAPHEPPSPQTAQTQTPQALAYGYEEALGYCVAPDHVRDKDGITAALAICELAASLKAEGRTLFDRLDELACEFGVHATDQLSVRVSDLVLISEAMARLRAAPPAALAGEPVTEFEDLLPHTDAVILRADATRVVVRPSGTEPKLKAYLEVIETVADNSSDSSEKPDGLAAARERAAARLAALRADTATALGV